MILQTNQRYLQIALNSTPEEALKIIALLPASERILIEAGTPLIKTHGIGVIEKLKIWRNQRFLNFSPYIVADIKCSDLARREVKMAAQAGATAATCLGMAPVETIDFFIDECRQLGLDSMIDMMNVEAPVVVLKKLNKLPAVVILHRGVDEETLNSEKTIPFGQIQAIKSNFDCLVAVAGGDTFQEVQRAVFNDADIVVLWKSFYRSNSQTSELAEQFLKEIK